MGVTPSALKLKTCKSLVRDPNVEGYRSHCGRQYLGDRCPDKDETHVLSLKTGYCNNGWCEGSKATDWRGQPVPTCKFIVTCPCECHDQLAKLFHMTGQERIVVDSSGYVHPERSFWLPIDEPVTVSSSRDDTPTVAILESPMPDRVPATLARSFTPTESGRAARGELESWVKQQCDIWLIDEPGEPCTPVYLAQEIGRDQGIMPPSVGAISAVFDRWTRLGFAICLKKPVRFDRYTEDGIKFGLEVMKKRAQRTKKASKSNARRGIR